MALGDLDYARFPIELDIDAAADTVPQVGISNPLLPSTNFDSIRAEILPITGGSGKSKAVLFIIGRQIV